MSTPMKLIELKEQLIQRGNEYLAKIGWAPFVRVTASEQSAWVSLKVNKDGNEGFLKEVEGSDQLNCNLHQNKNIIGMNRLESFQNQDNRLLDEETTIKLESEWKLLKANIDLALNAKNATKFSNFTKLVKENNLSQLSNLWKKVSLIDTEEDLVDNVHSFNRDHDLLKKALGSSPKYFVHIQQGDKHYFGLSKFCAIKDINLKKYLNGMRNEADGNVSQKEIARVVGKEWEPFASTEQKIQIAFEQWIQNYELNYELSLASFITIQVRTKEELQKGEVLNHQQAYQIFRCSPQGGMRRSHETQSLVLFSSHHKALYQDEWDDQNIFHYCGMGTAGDQDLYAAQNRTLAESGTNGVSVYLFESWKDNEYFYQGEVTLLDKPYRAKQLDSKGKERWVWLFPLTLKDGEQAYIPEEKIEKQHKKQEKAAKQLTTEVLEKRVRNKKSRPASRWVKNKQYERDPLVVELALRYAKGVCQLCEQEGPFKKEKEVYAFLEVHHIHYLSKGGPDTIDNVAALCPNCHRKMHALEDKKDVRKLKEVAEGYKEQIGLND